MLGDFFIVVGILILSFIVVILVFENDYCVDMSLDFRIFYDVSKFDGFFIVYCDYNNVLMIIVSLFGKGGRKDFVVCFIYFVIL